MKTFLIHGSEIDALQKLRENNIDAVRTSDGLTTSQPDEAKKVFTANHVIFYAL